MRKQAFEEKLTTLITPREVDATDFNESCAQFRELCHIIGQMIGVEDFRGGFDEIPQLYSFLSKLDITQQEGLVAYAQATQLVFSWIAMNESCKYLGSKLGFNQPEWWYQCWSMENRVPEET